MEKDKINCLILCIIDVVLLFFTKAPGCSHGLFDRHFVRIFEAFFAC